MSSELCVHFKSWRPWFRAAHLPVSRMRESPEVTLNLGFPSFLKKPCSLWMNWSSSIFRRKEHCSPTKEKEFKSCKVFFRYKKVTSSRQQFHGLNEDFSVQKQRTDCIRPESNCISLLVTAYLPLFPLNFVLKKKKKKKRKENQVIKKEVLKRHTLVNLFNLLKKIQGVEIPR